MAKGFKGKGFRTHKPAPTKGYPSAGPKAHSTSVGISTNVFRKPIRHSRKGFQK